MPALFWRHRDHVGCHLDLLGVTREREAQLHARADRVGKAVIEPHPARRKIADVTVGDLGAGLLLDPQVEADALVDPALCGAALGLATRRLDDGSLGGTA